MNDLKKTTTILERLFITIPFINSCIVLGPTHLHGILKTGTSEINQLSPPSTMKYPNGISTIKNV
jgi:hypothetical protein